MSTLSDWIDEVVRELGIDELGELVDPGNVQPLVLDMTKDVAHGVARPAAPITAYLLGLAVGRAAGSGPGSRSSPRASPTGWRRGPAVTTSRSIVGDDQRRPMGLRLRRPGRSR